MGRFAQHSNGLISHLPLESMEYHALPGRIRGRGAMLAKLNYKNTKLIIINVHLSLGKNARHLQLDYLVDLIPTDLPVIVLGDMNCGTNNPIINKLFSSRHLTCASDMILTYPSWHPKRTLDQAWVSPHLKVKKVQAKPALYSDHLPVMIEVELR
jgi:endonuclease/exonuclease/phosphatase family metal-dependent hydrolase